MLALLGLGVYSTIYRRKKYNESYQAGISIPVEIFYNYWRKETKHSLQGKLLLSFLIMNYFSVVAEEHKNPY